MIDFFWEEILEYFVLRQFTVTYKMDSIDLSKLLNF